MFSETRYALNGDLRVAYRASRDGPRDIGSSVDRPGWSGRPSARATATDTTSGSVIGARSAHQTGL
jgi:hypothetical protein